MKNKKALKKLVLKKTNSLYLMIKYFTFTTELSPYISASKFSRDRRIQAKKWLVHRKKFSERDVPA